MPKTIVRGRNAAKRTTSAQPSADAPIGVWVAGSFNAAELTRRLARGGLMLKTGEKGAVFLVHADREHPSIREARADLFAARAIIETVRLSMASKLEGRDLESTAADALLAASRMIDGVASDLGGAP